MRTAEPTRPHSIEMHSALIRVVVIATCLLWNACGGSSNTSPPPTKLPPTIAKAYGSPGVALTGTTTLSFTIANPNTSLSLSGIGFTDALPSGQVVATPNGLTGSCAGGTITASAESASVSLSSAGLGAGGSCTFAINVTGTSQGTQTNTTSAVTSNEAGNGGTASATLIVAGPSQQPPEPTDITPISGQAYYIVDQLSALQTDLDNGSTAAGANLVQQPRSFTSTTQRWTFTQSSGGSWQIGNVSNGLCFDSASTAGVTYVVQNPCSTAVTQEWTLTATANGYYTITNNSTGLLIDVPSTTGGALLEQTALSGSATQSQQWLLRPTFFRGVDNALLEKQEAARIATGLVWWKDTSGTQTDVLQILKNHGVNMVRIRPSSAPPYSNPSQAGCTGNACFAETDAQDIDLAKRTKNLGMSVELTLLFDGGSSSSVPAAWASDTLSQLETDIYNYVKAEVMSYRQAGAMPDMVSIGNEVDTGFLGSLGSPTGSDFSGFAALQIQAMQAVKDASSDTSIGPAIPAPLTCIHITPAWNLSQFFGLVTQNDIPYDAVCQSYYPFFHGPLTDAQAAESNPNNQPVEQDVLVAAANTLGKPIFIIEAAEHYENGFDSNDPWYSPPSQTLQAQFLTDLQTVMLGLPNNLGMGIEYWDGEGVDIPRLGGGWYNGGTNLPDAIYVWNGLTIFDNADSSGTTNVSDPNYSTPLPALDSLGGGQAAGKGARAKVARRKR
jgi:arabinogalactan endo-1,4-beta-galactosidase